MKKSVEQSLLEFLQQNPGLVFASGDLQRMTWHNHNGTLATPRSIVRRLQELCQTNKITNVGTPRAAKYTVGETQRPKKQVVVQQPDGSVKLLYV